MNIEEHNVVLFDWLSFTSADFDQYSMISLLGLDVPGITFEELPGVRGYHGRSYWSGISIHHGHDSEYQSVWVEMSGTGCRAFETFSSLSGDKWVSLFQRILSAGLHITRLDVAYDDHIGILDIDLIASDIYKQEYVSKANYWEILRSSKGTTCQIGSSSSEMYCRIYDKAAERGFSDRHWVRVELQLKNDRAGSFIDRLLNHDYDIGTLFTGVLVNFLRFVDFVEGDSNRWRWPIKDYWGELLISAEAISIYEAPGSEYNLYNLEQNVINRWGNAIDAYIKIKGIDGLLDNLKKRSTIPNPKYTRLINEYDSFNV